MKVYKKKNRMKEINKKDEMKGRILRKIKKIKKNKEK